MLENSRKRGKDVNSRMGIGRMIERAGETADPPFPVHVHMLRHSTGYALAARGMPCCVRTAAAHKKAHGECLKFVQGILSSRRKLAAVRRVFGPSRRPKTFYCRPPVPTWPYGAAR